MPPSKIRKNLIGLVNLAPEIEDVLMEKIDLPLCILSPIEKSKTQIKTTPSLKPSLTEMEILIAHALTTSIIRQQKDIRQLETWEQYKNLEMFCSVNIQNFIMEMEE